MQPLLDVVSDRHIAVVGNATSLLTTEHGTEIDAHECVVRFNRGFLAQPKSATGVRWDIWAVGGRMDPQVLDAAETRRPLGLIWARSPDCKAKIQFEEHTRGRWPEVTFYDQELRRQITTALGGVRPTTGLLMIAALLQRSQAKSIDVYGFDFFATPTFHGSTQISQLAHNPDRERRLFESYLAIDTRLRWINHG